MVNQCKFFKSKPKSSATNSDFLYEFYTKLNSYEWEFKYLFLFGKNHMLVGNHWNFPSWSKIYKIFDGIFFVNSNFIQFSRIDIKTPLLVDCYKASCSWAMNTKKEEVLFALKQRKNQRRLDELFHCHYYNQHKSNKSQTKIMTKLDSWKT